MTNEGALDARYREIRAAIESLLEGEDDWVAAMATVVCELHHGFGHYDWTGFYRVVAPEELAIGPYQGGHGCLRIPFSRGVCGAAARERRTQLVPDVHAFPGHIACASSTVMGRRVTTGPTRVGVGIIRRRRRGCGSR